MNIPLRALVLALVVGVAGCGGGNGSGGDGGGLDHDDPEAVAKAYYASFYDCGEHGAGLRWDLQVRGPEDWPRTRDLAAERARGCRPVPVPAIEVALGRTQNDVAIVAVDNPDGCTPGQATLALVRQSGGWKVDRSQSQYPGDDTSVCVAHGST